MFYFYIIYGGLFYFSFTKVFFSNIAKLQMMALMIINALSFCIYLSDKWAAQRGLQRTPEKELIALQFAGGAYGSIIAMLFSWHKIRKTKFIISSSLSFLLLSALLVYKFIKI